MAGLLVGQPVRRTEDFRFLTGTSRFVDDIPAPRAGHLVFVRSPYAHAIIRAVDTTRARAIPGVLLVFTGEDVRHLGRFVVGDREYGPLVPYQPLLAIDRVRFVGEPVAAIVAVSQEAAQDVVEAVDVAYEPLDAVVDPLAAMEPGAPALHADVPGNVCLRWEQTTGDVDAAFARAAHVVSVRMQVNRVAPVALEPRAVLARFDEGRNELTVWASTQVPHPLRAGIAQITGIPDTSIRVVAPDVGGGFGGKGVLKCEEVLVAWAAHQLKGDVKWVSSRAEDFVSTNHGRGLLHEAEAAVDAQGEVLALRLRTVHTPGAYVAPSSLLPLIRSSQFSTGGYRIQHVKRELVGVLTNTSSMGPNRGTGRPESILMLERVMDETARILGIDPLEVRQRNLVTASEFPYRAPTGVELDSGNYQAAVARVLELADYDELRREQSTARERGEYVGIGLSTCVGMTATGMWQSASVRMERSGRVTVMTGSAPHGQGHETVWAQVAADALGVRFADVHVVYGDTATAPYAVGTVGTNGAALAASSVQVACQRLRTQVLAIAAHQLEVQVDDLEIVDSRVQVIGVPERFVTVASIAAAAYGGPGLPDGMELGLEASARFRQSAEPFSFGAFIAVTRVDPETGRVTVDRVFGVDDCGTVLNPLVMHGQAVGGVAWGMGQVLSEAIRYDETGQPLTRSLLDYALPRATWMPRLVMDHTVTPTPLNPLGAKGGAEGANIAVPAAIYNSVLDALAPLGVREIDMPLTAQNVWRALESARPVLDTGENGAPAFRPHQSSLAAAR